MVEIERSARALIIIQGGRFFIFLFICFCQKKIIYIHTTKLTRYFLLTIHHLNTIHYLHQVEIHHLKTRQYLTIQVTITYLLTTS